MSKQNKDSLENFFRERTLRHNLEFNEGDWLKLEKQLDQEMPVAFTFSSFLKKFWVIPLVIFLIPGSWYTYELISNNRSIETTESPAVSGKIIDDNKSNSDASTASEMHSESLTPLNSRKVDDDNPSTQKNLESKQQNVHPTHSVKSNNNIAEQKKFIPTIQGEEFTAINEHSGVNQSKNIGYAVLGNGAKSNVDRSDFGLHFLFPIVPEALIADNPDIDYIAYEEINEISPMKSRRSYFYTGIGYSPDFSTVGIGNFVAPGSRWTILFEYGYSKRFLLNTGVVWVNNKYEAYGEDYHAPSRYWKKGIVADEAYGECKMIDIPLNLRYNFLVKGKSQAFVSAGASTYFLLKEDYYFHYDQEDPELPDHWGTDKMTVYPFGIVNFSFGYQYQFSKKSGIQIEPFIKIPTTGVGWGKVDLHTMGVYFMYKYRISR